jgi:hypothetical protein
MVHCLPEMKDDPICAKDGTDWIINKKIIPGCDHGHCPTSTSFAIERSRE